MLYVTDGFTEHAATLGKPNVVACHISHRKHKWTMHSLPCKSEGHKPSHHAFAGETSYDTPLIHRMSVVLEIVQFTLNLLQQGIHTYRGTRGLMYSVHK